MDIELFSKCLKYLLLKNDEMVVPGLGTFSAQTIPASHQEDGTPIPPYRKISYSPADKEDDGTFLRWMAKFLHCEEDEARDTFRDFIEDLSGELDQTRCVELTGLGSLRSTGHKIYYFTCNNDLFIYPDVPGQESVGAMLPEELAEEESKPIELSDEKWAREGAEEGEEGDPQPAQGPQPGAMPSSGQEPQPDAETQPATASSSGRDLAQKRKPGSRRNQVIDLNIGEEPEEEDALKEPESPQSRLIGNILLIAFVVLIFLMIAVTLFKDMPWMDNLLDHLLYTKEELEILGK